MIIDFNNKEQKTERNEAERTVLASAFKESHEKVSALYQQAITKRADTKVLFKLLTFFEERKYLLENNTIDFEKEFENNKLFATLISQVMLSKLSDHDFIGNKSIKELNTINDQNIINYFNNYENESIHNFEVKL